LIPARRPAIFLLHFSLIDPQTETPLRITFLGTGTSHGVPIIACDCDVCRSDDPRNSRTRASIHIEDRGTYVQVDAGPEFRLQCIANGVEHIDAVLLTHSHADHVLGLDDLRRFNHIIRGAIPIYGEEDTLARVREVFAYAFQDGQVGGGKPKYDLRPINGPITIGALEVVPMRVWHGELPVTAFRAGAFAYVTDANRIPPETLDQLADLDTLVLDGLRYRPHATHLNIEQGIEVARSLKPKRTYLTHMTHDLDYQRLCDELPEGIEPAYDGLVIEVP